MSTMTLYRYCNACGLHVTYWQIPVTNDPKLGICGRCGAPTHDFRRIVTDPDGGQHYCNLNLAPDGRGLRDGLTQEHAWHLVGCGRNFSSPEVAQAWLHEHWNDESPIDDTSYARAETSFGEQP